MYCSTCGTKLADNASFCPNCGTKVEKEEAPVTAAPVAPVVEEIKVEEPAAPVVEEVKVEEPAAPVVEEVKAEEPAAPVVEEVKAEEPVAPVVEEVKAEEPAAPVVEEVKVEEPAAPVVEEVKVEEPVAPVVEEVKAEEPVAPVVEEVKAEEPVAPVVEEVKAEEPVAPAPEPVKAVQPTPAPQPAKKAKEKKPKKKGKGCLIAVIIFIIIAIIIGILLLVLGVGGFFIIRGQSGTKKIPVPYDYNNMTSYYGNYTGTSYVDQTSGAQSLSDFYSTLGYNVDADALKTDKAEYPFAIAVYNTDISPASWDLTSFAGDYLDYMSISNYDCISNEQYANENYFYGDLMPDALGNFEIYIDEKNDNLSNKSSFGQKFLGIDADKEGEYQITIKGKATANDINGTIFIIMQYEGMDAPYSESIVFTSSK